MLGTAIRLGLLLWLFGCTSLHIHSSGMIDTHLTRQDGQEEIAVKEGVLKYYLWGLIPGDQELSLDKEFESLGLVSVGNIKIEEYQSMWNFLKSIASFGFYIPMNYRITAFGLRPDEKIE